MWRDEREGKGRWRRGIEGERGETQAVKSDKEWREGEVLYSQ